MRSRHLVESVPQVVSVTPVVRSCAYHSTPL
jgi:hypothetical protein